MATLKEIRNRIRTINNTRQITRAMKMVAAANLRHVQGSMNPAKEYAAKTEEILANLFSLKQGNSNCYVKPKEETGIAVYVLVVGNRGLCGVYNTALLNFAKKEMEKDHRSKKIIVIGKWGREVMSHMGLQIEDELVPLSENPLSGESRALADRLKKIYWQEDTEDVYLIRQTYVSALKQEPDIMHLFPLGTALMEKLGAVKEENQNQFTDYYFEPGKQELVDRLIETYIDSFVLACLKEAKCAEHSARMTAMTNANENIDQLLAKLQTNYNRVRQENITNEISEIVGGAAALK